MLEMGYEFTSHTLYWLNNIPYQLVETKECSELDKQKLPEKLYQEMEESDINIVVESHFDPFWNFSAEKFEYAVRDFSPAFPTEKTYKAIACNRPFIMFSTPYFLQEFRELGYKTFHPYIDESYDNIEDNMSRLQAIVAEIERLSNMSYEEFKALMNKIAPIAAHNKRIMEEKIAELPTKLTGKWQFFSDIINDNFVQP